MIGCEQFEIKNINEEIGYGLFAKKFINVI